MQDKDLLDKEITDLQASNSHFKEFQIITGRRNKAEFHIFDFGSDEEDEPTTEVSDQIQKLARDFDQKMYDYIFKLVKKVGVLEALRVRRKGELKESVSHSLKEACQLTPIDDSDFQNIIAHEKKLLKEARTLAKEKGILRQTNIEECLDRFNSDTTNIKGKKRKLKLVKEKSKQEEKQVASKKKSISKVTPETSFEPSLPSVSFEDVLTCNEALNLIINSFDLVTTKSPAEQVKFHLIISSTLRLRPFELYQALDFDNPVILAQLELFDKDNRVGLEQLLNQVMACLENSELGKSENVLRSYQICYQLKLLLADILPNLNDVALNPKQESIHKASLPKARLLRDFGINKINKKITAAANEKDVSREHEKEDHLRFT